MMANNGSKPSLDGIVRTRPAVQNGTPDRPVQPLPQKPVRPIPQQPIRQVPRPAVAEPSQPKLVRRPVAEVEEVDQEPLTDQPQKKSGLRKAIKTVVVLLVLAAFAFGIWWVYLSYFA